MNSIKIEIIGNPPSEKFIRNFESSNRRTEKYWGRKGNVVVTEIITTKGGNSI